MGKAYLEGHPEDGGHSGGDCFGRPGLCRRRPGRSEHYNGVHFGRAVRFGLHREPCVRGGGLAFERGAVQFLFYRALFYPGVYGPGLCGYVRHYVCGVFYYQHPHGTGAQAGPPVGAESLPHRGAAGDQPAAAAGRHPGRAGPQDGAADPAPAGPHRLRLSGRGGRAGAAGRVYRAGRSPGRFALHRGRRAGGGRVGVQEQQARGRHHRHAARGEMPVPGGAQPGQRVCGGGRCAERRGGAGGV